MLSPIGCSHRLRRVVQKLDSLKGGVKLRFFTLIFWWFLIAHWFACLWWFIGRTGYQDAEFRERQGLPRRNDTTWLVRIPPTGTAATGFSVSAFEACVARCATARHSRACLLRPSSPCRAPTLRLTPPPPPLLCSIFLRGRLLVMQLPGHLPAITVAWRRRLH